MTARNTETLSKLVTELLEGESFRESLAEGGQPKMPLTRQPWGAEVGWLSDKFGINWTVVAGR